MEHYTSVLHNTTTRGIAFSMLVAVVLVAILVLLIHQHASLDNSNGELSS